MNNLLIYLSSMRRAVPNGRIKCTEIKSWSGFSSRTFGFITNYGQFRQRRRYYKSILISRRAVRRAVLLLLSIWERMHGNLFYGRRTSWSL